MPDVKTVNNNVGILLIPVFPAIMPIPLIQYNQLQF